MKTIWKFSLELTDNQIVSMPVNAEILTAQMQRSQICLWVTLETNNTEMYEHVIEIFGTGNPIPLNVRKYIASVQDGSVVWHIFEQM